MEFRVFLGKKSFSYAILVVNSAISSFVKSGSYAKAYLNQNHLSKHIFFHSVSDNSLDLISNLYSFLVLSAILLI